MTAASELELFLKTGHFLAGRLWQDMSDAEKAELEALAGDVQTFEDGHRLILHGDVCDCSTMLVDEFMLRTLESEDRRYGGSFHVRVTSWIFTASRLNGSTTISIASVPRRLRRCHTPRSRILCTKSLTSRGSSGSLPCWMPPCIANGP